jgi:hypothetical protein
MHMMEYKNFAHKGISKIYTKYSSLLPRIINATLYINIQVLP